MNNDIQKTADNQAENKNENIGYRFGQFRYTFKSSQKKKHLRKSFYGSYLDRNIGRAC